MCGCYARSPPDDALALDFEVADVVGGGLRPSWNVAPTQAVRVVLERLGGDGSGQEPGVDPDAGSGGGPVRQLRTARWGLVPPWAKDRSVGARMINARVETVTEKPAYKAAAARRRALVPADGYYEWAVQAGTKAKTPYFLQAEDGGLLGFAGLYERWTDRSLPEEDPGRVLWTVTILTTTAPDALGHVHDRTPVILPRALRAAWLDPATTDPAEVRALLAAVPEPRLHPHRVGPAVGSVRNNGPELAAPL